jgi:hypothetical protein
MGNGETIPNPETDCEAHIPNPEAKCLEIYKGLQKVSKALTEAAKAIDELKRTLGSQAAPRRDSKPGA